MRNKLNTARLIRAAEKLGFKVEINSKTPGFSVSKTAEIHSWDEIAEDIKKRFKVDKKH